MMAFPDWEFFFAVPAHQAYIDLTAPLVGAGSLRMQGATSPGAIQCRWGQETQRGYRQGRVTTLLSPLVGVAGVDMFGVYGLASQPNLTGSVGTAFAAVLVPGTPWEARLLQVTGGFGGTPTVLQATALPTMTYNQVQGLQLQWVGNPQTGTGLRIALGTALDFTDLVALPFVQLPTVHILTSEGEGLVAYLSSTGVVLFDQTQIEEI